MKRALAVLISITLAACSGGSGNSGSSSISTDELLKDVFPTSGDALAWSLKATNATELKTYFEKAVSAADKVQIIPPALPTVSVPVAGAPGASSTTSTTSPSNSATPSLSTVDG